jgi:hypothetical protein
MMGTELKPIMAVSLFTAALVFGAAPARAEVRSVWVGVSGATCGT